MRRRSIEVTTTRPESAGATLTILLIEDDERDRRMLLASLREKYHVVVAVDYVQAKDRIEKGDFDVVFLDLMLPRAQGERIDENGKYGLDLLRQIREADALTPVVVISGLATVKTAMKVLSYGIVDFVVKDDLEDQLPLVMKRAEMIRQGRVEQLILRRESPWQDGAQHLIYRSEAMQEVMGKVDAAASDDTAVLLYGETGTGKELVAREIHRRSPRSSSPFIAVNCGAIPAALVESELFGHEKGAFTGAEKRKHGLIELAHNGTLFLDEIGDLPIDLQVRLLRVLQEKTIRRVGGEKEIAVNIRVICATNRDLQKAIKERQFREDLFYRIAVFRLYIPPLRERLDDVELLCEHFVRKYRPGLDVSFSFKALKLLKLEAWPGNIRELESVIQRLVNEMKVKRGSEVTIQAGDLVKFLSDEPKPPAIVYDDEFDLTLVEKRVIRRAMEVFRQQDLAAEQLGLSLSTLRRKIRDYGIKYERIRRKTVETEPRPARPNRRDDLLKLASQGEFTTQQAIAALGLSRKSTFEHLNELVSAGYLRKIERGRYGLVI
jgi:DNA-binding NtrC family response regulator